MIYEHAVTYQNIIPLQFPSKMRVDVYIKMQTLESSHSAKTEIEFYSYVYQPALASFTYW